jgi:hypothetical protein
MWEPRRLKTLWASTACYRDSFNFLVEKCVTLEKIREQDAIWQTANLRVQYLLVYNTLLIIQPYKTKGQRLTWKQSEVDGRIRFRCSEYRNELVAPYSRLWNMKNLYFTY